MYWTCCWKLEAARTEIVDRNGEGKRERERERERELKAESLKVMSIKAFRMLF